MEFEDFQKIPRLSREMIITEKIDGTNAQIYIETLGVGLHEPQIQNWGFSYAKETQGGTTFIFAGSRTRWVTPGKNTDNAGFAGWVKVHAEELLALGEGRHFGEWWGKGIQRNYGLSEKRFSLFNVGMWHSKWNTNFESGTECLEIPLCHVVPIIGKGEFETDLINTCLNSLIDNGSFASPGFTNPEGVVIYHTGGGYLFKKTIEKDDLPKSLAGISVKESNKEFLTRNPDLK